MINNVSFDGNAYTGELDSGRWFMTYGPDRVLFLEPCEVVSGERAEEFWSSVMDFVDR